MGDVSGKTTTEAQAGDSVPERIGKMKDVSRKVITRKRALVAMLLACFLVLFTLQAAAEPPPVELAEGGTLSPPEGIAVLHRPEDVGKRIALTWRPVAGAFGYLVYRSESADGELVPVGGRAADSMRDYPVFLDDTAVPGRSYFYAVAAVDESLRQGPLSPRVPASLEPEVAAAGGPKRMVCSLSDQRIYFYEGDQLVNVMRCSTGLNNATPMGSFRILAHYRVHGGLGGAVCDYWMSFTSSHGMHSWPRGSSRYEAGLGAPASHGCIRLHPLEAYWPYYWAPDGTPLTITYASLARRVVSGCHDTQGAEAPSKEWYFAEGCTDFGFDTFLLLSNPGDGGFAARVDFYRDDGITVTENRYLPPHSRLTVPVDQLPGLEAASFAIRVEATGLVVAERAMYFTMGNRDDGTVTVGATAPFKEWYFAEGFTANSFDTFLLLSNPGSEPTTARVFFYLEGGGNARYDFLLPPRSRHTVSVDSLPAVASASFCMRVESDLPIVAERAMYFNLGYIGGGHASVGAPELSRDWYFAEGCTRNFFSTFLLLGNPTGQDTIVHVEYLLPDGNLRYDYLLRAGSRVTVDVGSQGGLSGQDVAMAVHSDHPIVAERAVYYNLDSHWGGHAAMGSREASNNWYFAEGYTDGAFDTYLLLSNPGSSPAFVNVVFLREDGSTFGAGYLVQPHRRVTVHVDDLPGMDRTSFSMNVHADQPVVAERAMYFVMPRGY